MSDLACWRIRWDADHEGFVLRIHGSEHHLDENEAHELTHMLYMVSSKGIPEMLGAEYAELQANREAQAANTKALQGVGLLAKLGLKRTATPLKRRQV